MTRSSKYGNWSDDQIRFEMTYNTYARLGHNISHFKTRYYFSLKIWRCTHIMRRIWIRTNFDVIWGICICRVKSHRFSSLLQLLAVVWHLVGNVKNPKWHHYRLNSMSMSTWLCYRAKKIQSAKSHFRPLMTPACGHLFKHDDVLWHTVGILETGAGQLSP